MSGLISVFSCVLLCSVLLAQDKSPLQPRPLSRQVRGQTIESKELPVADLTFGTDFRYMGGQIVNLYGNADAEQHLFVRRDGSGPVTGFYWVQFEHFLPTNTSTYDYHRDRTVSIGPLLFIYDVKSFSDYAALETDDPASDGAAIRRLLAQHDLTLPRRTVRVRMFHLPTADRRSELMIIYGETLPDKSQIPATADGVSLDDTFHSFATTILHHAQKGLSIRRP